MWTWRDAMHINTTGMAFPLLERISAPLTRRRMVLLDPQIANGMACCTDGGEQLRFAVQQGLAPLGMTGSHRQHSAPQG